MSRITDRVLVQRVDDLIVVLDESTGDEVTFPVEVAPQAIAALHYLTGPWNGEAERA
jgi:hypothetical protein